MPCGVCVEFGKHSMEGQRYSRRQSIELVSNGRTWVCLRATHGAHNDDEKAGPHESFLRFNEIKWHNLSGTRRNSCRIRRRSDLKSEIERALSGIKLVMVLTRKSRRRLAFLATVKPYTVGWLIRASTYIVNTAVWLLHIPLRSAQQYALEENSGYELTSKSVSNVLRVRVSSNWRVFSIWSVMHFSRLIIETWNIQIGCTNTFGSLATFPFDLPCQASLYLYPMHS